MFVPSIIKSLRQGRTKIKVEEAVREHKMILKAVKEKNVAKGMEAIYTSLRAWKKDKYKIGE